MQTRTDLQCVAAQLAANAAGLVSSDDHVGNPHDLLAADLARGARDALQAAALLDVDPAPVTAAIERLVEQVEPLGLDVTLKTDGVAAAIDLVGDLLIECQREVAVGVAVQHGYASLRDLLDGLLRDFTAADTDTARRIAARIHAGLEQASDAIKTAKQTEGATD